MTSWIERKTQGNALQAWLLQYMKTMHEIYGLEAREAAIAAHQARVQPLLDLQRQNKRAHERAEALHRLLDPGKHPGHRHHLNLDRWPGGRIPWFDPFAKPRDTYRDVSADRFDELHLDLMDTSSPQLVALEKGALIVPPQRHAVSVPMVIRRAKRMVRHPLLMALARALDLRDLAKAIQSVGTVEAPWPSPNLEGHSTEWVLWHGPNGLEFYPGYADIREEHYDAYVLGYESGPGTGLISAQAKFPGDTSWGQTPVPLAATEWAYLWRHPFLDQRWAQAAAFLNTGNPHPDPQADIDAKMRQAFGVSARAPAPADPFLVPKRLPVAGAAGRAHNTPAVSEAIRALAHPALGNVSIQPGRLKPGITTSPLPFPAPQPAPALPGNPIVPHLPHTRSPPGPGVKENKNRAVAAAHVIGDAIGMTTEVMDMIDALHASLPKHLQAKSFHGGRPVAPGLQKKFDHVYRHINHIDMAEAIENLVVNQIEDRVIGQATGGANKRVDTDPLTGKRRAPGVGRFRRFRH